MDRVEFEYLVGGESGMHIFFKSEQDIVTMLQDEGITEGMMPYSFCQGGGAATVNFFVFDALLGTALQKYTTVLQ